MKTLNRITLIVLLVTSMVIYSCTSCQHNSKENEKTARVNFENLSVIDSTEAVFYALPTPEEILKYINTSEASFNSSLMYPASEAKGLTSSETKAVTLGIYLGDIAYVTFYERNNHLIEYIDAIDFLMRELNINPDLTPEQQDLIYNSTYDYESIYSISKELYDVIIEYLENFDQGKTLSLISIGALTESIYVATNINNDTNVNNVPIMKIGEQKRIYEDVLIMIESYQFTKYTNLHADLTKLKKSFDLFNTSNTNPNAQVIQMSDHTSSISKENYEKFRNSINTFRNILIK